MRFNTRIGVFAAVITTGIYLVLPDLHEGRFDQVVTYTALYYVVALFCAWAANELVEVQRKRKKLSLSAKRVDLTSRHGKVVDIRVKRQSKAVIIPAYKVAD